jgi:uncharacterized protein (DUF58 family)
LRVSPTLRCALLAAGLPVLVLVLPGWFVVLLALVLAGMFAADVAAVRAPATVERTLPRVAARGVPSPLLVRTETAGHLRLRQPQPPEIGVEPAESDRSLDAVLRARRRGRHELPGVVARRTGPLGLGRRDRVTTEPAELLVYPDLPAARALVHLVRNGRIGEQGRRRGVLGLGTDFEAIREYSLDDDIRQVNWRATARTGRPMSNQYRVDQDRDVICVVDSGRLMAAPVGDRTRLDAALDAVTAVSLVADELGDRSGALAFDGGIRAEVQPRRQGARHVVDALFDLEPSNLDSDYDRAFRRLDRKRSLVLVFTDIVESAAAAPLLEAVPWLVRRHAVIVASCRDADLEQLLAAAPAKPVDAYAAAVALDVLEARRRVVGGLREAGATVIEAHAGDLATACVRAYVRLKSRALV